ncbi:unnamed protein product [Malus baccata var. baccata]
MSSSRLSFLHQAAYLPMEHGGGRRSSSDLGVVCACSRPPSRISSELPCPTARLPSGLPYPPSLLPNKTHCTDTFGEWWEKYTQEFFGAPVEDVLSRLFGDRPKKASAPHTQGSRPLRKTEAVAAAMAGKKSVVAQKDKPTGRAVLVKRPRQEAEPVVEPSPPAKLVKQLAKKGAREIHVISSHTTGTTTPSASPSPAAGQPMVEKQPASVTKTAQARPVSVADAPVVPPSVEKAPVPQQAVSTAEETSPKNPKPSVFVLEESEGSDEVPLTHRPHPRRPPPLVSETAVQAGPSTADRGKRPVEEPPAVAEPLAPSQEQGVPSAEETVPVGPSIADRGKRPVEEPEATAESPVHPQDQGFHIPPQEHDCRVRPFGRSD